MIKSGKNFLQGAGVEVPCGAKFPPSLVFGEIDAQGWQVMFLHNWVFKKTKQKQKNHQSMYNYFVGIGWTIIMHFFFVHSKYETYLSVLFSTNFN